MNNIKEMDRKTTEIERKVKKIGKKVRFYGIIGCILLGFGLAFYLFFKISQFYDENRVLFQSPIIIKLQAPVKVEKRMKQVKKAPVMPLAEVKPVERVKSEFEIVQAQKHGNILWNIYLLETGRGKNDYCRINGTGYGGFGVMNGKEVVCYPTFDKAVERAEYWLAKLEPDKSLVNALCSYNLGTANAPYVNCSYYLNYISL
jgi:hypothetical protein